MKKRFDYLKFVPVFTALHDDAYKVSRLFIRTLYGKVEDEINDIIFLDTCFKFNLVNPATFEIHTFTLPSSWLNLEVADLKSKINAKTYEELQAMEY